MQIIELEQGSSEWKDFRRQHVCASDVGAILGEGYRSAAKVYKEKIFGEEENENESMWYGKSREPIAREYFNQKMGIDFKPIVAVSDDYPWIMASLDGWDGETVLEIKCSTRYEKFMEIASLNVSPPRQYLWQVQTQLLVTGAKSAFLSYFIDEPLVAKSESVELLIVKDSAMQERIIAETKTFWFDHVLEYKEPESKRKRAAKKKLPADSLSDLRTA